MSARLDRRSLTLVKVPALELAYLVLQLENRIWPCNRNDPGSFAIAAKPGGCLLASSRPMPIAQACWCWRYHGVAFPLRTRSRPLSTLRSIFSLSASWVHRPRTSRASADRRTPNPMTNHLCRMQKSAVRRMDVFNIVISSAGAEWSGGARRPAPRSRSS
jgi:hypothetical protein